MGITDDIDKYIEDAAVRIDKDDLVLLFTDGITETMNDKGEMFGQDRLENALHQFADLPVNKILEKIMSEVNAFQKEQLDDMTLVVIRKSS